MKEKLLTFVRWFGAEAGNGQSLYETGKQVDWLRMCAFNSAGSYVSGRFLGRLELDCDRYSRGPVFRAHVCHYRILPSLFFPQGL